MPKRVLDQLDRLAEARVATIIAPAGYGKSALVRAWLERHPELDDRTIAVIVRRGRGLNVGNLDAPLEQLIAEDADAPVYIWIDNHHRILEPGPLHQVLDLLQEYPQVRVILAGRTRPPVALGSLAMRGQLVAITQPDLALNEPEAEELLAQDATPAEVHEILDRYHGWPIALQLIASMGPSWRQGFRVDETVDGYIEEEVLAGLDPDDLRLLEDLSPARSFTPELARYLTGRPDVATELTRLAGMGVPIEWNEYAAISFNPAVRAHLIRRLQRNHPGRLELLNRQISGWLQGQGRQEDAVRHALASRDPELLVETLTDTVIRRLGISHETAAEWVDTIAPKVPESYIVGLLRTLVKSVAQPFGVSSQGLLSLRQSMPADVNDDELGVFHGIVLLVSRPHHYAASRGLVEAAVQFASRALDGEITVRPLPLAALMMEYGQYLLATGDVKRSQDALELSIATSQIIDLGWLGAISQSVLAFVHALTGSASTAQRLAEEVLLTPTRAAGCWPLEYSMLTKSVIALDRGEAALARTILEELRGISGGRTPLVSGAEVFRLALDTYIRVLEGDAPSAVVEIQTYRAGFAGDLTDYQRFTVANAAFTARLSQGALVDAQRELDEILALDLRPELDVVRTIDSAMLQLAHGEIVPAYEQLVELARHRQEGNQGSRKQWVTALALLARAATETGHAPEATEAQQAAVALANRLGLLPPVALTIIAEPDGATTASAETSPLTPAEKQVLVALATDAPLADVAGQLFISQNTLKTHLRRIYKKLGVTGRTEAVALARAQGLA